MSRNAGAEGEYGRVYNEGSGIGVAKRCERSCDTDGGGRWMCYVLDRKVVAEKEGFVVWEANGQFLVPFPSPLYEQLDTSHASLVTIFSLPIYLIK